MSMVNFHIDSFMKRLVFSDVAILRAKSTLRVSFSVDIVWDILTKELLNHKINTFENDSSLDNIYNPF